MNEYERLITAPDTMLEEIGSNIAMNVSISLRNQSVDIYTDEQILAFLPALIAEGNLDFIKACAENMYNDTRKEVIIEFLNELWKLTQKGEKLLKEM